MRIIQCQKCNKTLIKLARESVITKQGLHAYCIGCDPANKEQWTNFGEFLRGFKQ